MLASDNTSVGAISYHTWHDLHATLQNVHAVS